MELKYFDKLKGYRILSDSGGPPPGGLVDGCEGWHGCVWGCLMHAHMHVKHAKHGCLYVGGHLQFLYMYKCACVCMCVGIPAMPPDAPPHLPAPSPEPQGAQNTKIQ